MVIIHKWKWKSGINSKVEMEMWNGKVELIQKWEWKSGNGKVDLIPKMKIIPKVEIENKRKSYNLKVERKIYLAER